MVMDGIHIPSPESAQNKKERLTRAGAQRINPALDNLLQPVQQKFIDDCELVGDGRQMKAADCRPEPGGGTLRASFCLSPVERNSQAKV